MAQVIRRKASVPREAVPRPPPPHANVKAFGDAAGKQSKTRNKSKTKMPKTLRHDLENALVNLCDIWFEEIKPHLIRNNIKLHVHEDKAGGEGCLPTGAPGCSHLDPGAASDRLRARNATCASSCSPQRTTSRVPLRRPPRRPTTPPDLRRHTMSQNQQNHNEVQPKARKRRRKVRKDVTQSEGPLRVPRLCQTYGLSPPPPPKSCSAKRKSAHSKHVNSIVMKYKKMDKSTQTENFVNVFSSASYCIIPKGTKPPVSNENRPVPISPLLPRKRRPEPPLFKKDLLNIICSEHDKRLQVLYKGPSRSNISSIMNLMPGLQNMQHKKLKKRRSPRPWK